MNPNKKVRISRLDGISYGLKLARLSRIFAKKWYLLPDSEREEWVQFIALFEEVERKVRSIRLPR